MLAVFRRPPIEYYIYNNNRKNNQDDDKKNHKDFQEHFCIPSFLVPAKIVKEIKVPCKIIDDPLTSVVRGAGLALENIQSLSEVMSKDEG